MELIPSIFEQIKLPILVWKIIDDNIAVIYSNNRLELANNEKECSLNEYTNKFKKNNKIKFIKFLKDHDKIEIETGNYIIMMEFLGKDTFFEFYYPKSYTEFVLSSISYKIRTPLTNIIGLLQLLEQYNKNDKHYQNYLNIIKNSSADIVSVANDIIDLLNIKQNKLVATKREINLDQLIKECIRPFAAEAEKKKINLLYKIDKHVPKTVYTDKEKLKQIIVKILKNAMNNISVGVISIDVCLNVPKDDSPFTYTETSPPKFNLLFKIKDTGSGMDSKTVEILELILAMKNTAVTNSTKINGFGLYICKSLCELLHGKLWFETKEDIGSVFFFNIICKNYD